MQGRQANLLGRLEALSEESEQLRDQVAELEEEKERMEEELSTATEEKKKLEEQLRDEKVRNGLEIGIILILCNAELSKIWLKSAMFDSNECC